MEPITYRYVYGWDQALEAFGSGDPQPLADKLVGGESIPENVRHVLSEVLTGERKITKKRGVKREVNIAKIAQIRHMYDLLTNPQPELIKMLSEEDSSESMETTHMLAKLERAKKAKYAKKNAIRELVWLIYRDDEDETVTQSRTVEQNRVKEEKKNIEQNRAAAQIKQIVNRSGAYANDKFPQTKFGCIVK